MEKNPNRSAKLFGRGREPKQPGDPLVVTDETSAWEIYNHKASEVDREMLKDWNDNLNTLLIFTALYSAVLTAFIIESMKLLQEDMAETTRDILVVVSRQLADSTFPAFEQVAYQIPQYAIIVNGLFFTSLSCALLASLLAVLALQWVANYDMGLNTSSARKRALQRHVRLRGIEKWKMSELIAALPILIFVALFLFFVGIANWLWHMNQTISGIVIGGIGIGCLLYAVTNVISIINVDAPFRTPVSKELLGIVRRYMPVLKNVVAELRSILRGKKGWHTLGDVTIQSLTFTKHEEKAFEGRDAVTLDGLSWLATHIEILPVSTDIFIALLKELTKVPAQSLMDTGRTGHGPAWEAVFEILCTPYISNKEHSADELERARWICKGLGIIPQGLQQRTFQKFLEGLHKSVDPSISSLAYFASYKQYPDRGSCSRDRLTMMGEALGYTGKAVSQIGANYLHFMLLNLEKQWPYLDIYQRTFLVHRIAHAWNISSAMIRDGSSSVVVPVHLMQIIHDLVAVPIDGNVSVAQSPPERHQMQVNQWNEAYDRLFRAMEQQLISQISRKFRFLSDEMKELKLLSLLGRSKPLGNREKDALIWDMITKHREYDEPHEFQKICDILCMGLRCDYTIPAWIGLVPALDDFLARLPPHSFHFYSEVIHFIHRFVEVSIGVRDSFRFKALMGVRDPCLAWIISWQCPSDFQFHALIKPNVDGWNRAVEHEITNLLYAYSGRRHTIVDSDSRIAFFRAILLDNPSNAHTRILEILTRCEWRSSDAKKWQALLALPMLSVIFEESTKSDVFSIRSLFIQIVQFQWFYEEFHRANGLDWLLRIAQNGIHPDDRLLKNDILTEILVDEILFSAVSQDIQVPLSMSYRYLQSVGESAPQTQYESNIQGLANLKIALLWVHDSKDRAELSSRRVLIPANLERLYWPSHGKIRSFRFVSDMSNKQWQKWVERLKILIMGTSLGGLRPGPVQNGSRFFRDPDGVCGACVSV
ncbi:hypothetical protein CPB86DRAFT_779957 [Serendipita vermifera]|nr:hypothetical protein CPB86DRAFT_779957 [Serendipita vermifera]